MSVAASTVPPAELLRAVSAVGGQLAVSSFEPCPAHITTGSLAVCCFYLSHFRLELGAGAEEEGGSVHDVILIRKAVYFMGKQLLSHCLGCESLSFRSHLMTWFKP